VEKWNAIIPLEKASVYKRSRSGKSISVTTNTDLEKVCLKKLIQRAFIALRL
jgi:hypothetical protein